MEIVLDALVFLAHVLAGVAFVVVAGVALAAALEGLAAVVLFVVGRFKRVRETPSELTPTEVPPSFSLALMVRFDDDSGCFRPSVQVRGYGELTQAWIRLELVDPSGTVRLIRRRRLARTAIETELPLPPFEPPEGTSIDEVLGWHWDVVIEDKLGERARWREHPHPAAYLNAEAELA